MQVAQDCRLVEANSGLSEGQPQPGLGPPELLLLRKLHSLL